MSTVRFEDCPDVVATGVDGEAFDGSRQEVLHQAARFCQAMVDANGAALRDLVDPEAIFTHMSGRRQTRDEFIADVTRGALRYHAIAMERPTVRVEGDVGAVSYTSVLDANAYGAKGVYRMQTSHLFERRDGVWTLIGS